MADVTAKELLLAVVILLVVIAWQIGKISRRLKERFPTEAEQDAEWARKDPAGHWEAHRKK